MHLRAHVPSSAGTQKCYFIATRHVAPDPCLGLFELRAPIESISGFITLFPLCHVLAEGLLKADILSCLVQPVGEPCPLADQCLMADFHGGNSSNRVGGEQTCSGEGLNGFSQQTGLNGGYQRELRERRTAARGILFGHTWIDQP